MIHLKEAEAVSHSNNFQIQINELLKQIKVKEKWKSKFESWFQFLTEKLTSLPVSETYKITDQTWLRKDVKVPIVQDPFDMKGIFKFLPPSIVKLVGSYPIGLSCGPNFTLDVSLEIPKECWQKSDFLNHRYHRKRALYLAYIACFVQDKELIECIHYSYHHGNHMKPVLLVTPKGKLGKHFKVCLLLSISKDVFKVCRFIPERNNVRPSWYFQDEDLGGMDIPTPHYNYSILSDMLMDDHCEFLSETLAATADPQGFKDGILLIKVWLRQRHLDKNFGGYTGFIVTIFVAYLLSFQHISELLSSYQVFRIFLLSISQASWTNDGISLGNGYKKSMNIEQNFGLITTKFCIFNLMMSTTRMAFDQLQHEAILSLRILNSNLQNNFDALFMTPVSFFHKFDHIIHVNNLSQIITNPAMSEIKASFLDNSGDITVSIMPKMYEIIRKALTNRISQMTICRSGYEEYSLLECGAEKIRGNESISIGLLINSEIPDSSVDRGPTGDSLEAKEFRDFWGDKSELRRFNDGTICEAVVWPGGNLAEKRLAAVHIVKYILNRHCGIDYSTMHHAGVELESLLYIPNLSLPSQWPPYGTGDEVQLQVFPSFNSLSKELRKLDLPLSIISVQGVSPIFRLCEVFPSFPTNYHIGKKITFAHGDCLALKGHLGKAPRWIKPLEVVVTMETSGKWPDDVEAIKRVKAAFHVKIADLMKSQFSFPSHAHFEYVDILKDGYVFRIRIACHKEIILLKQVKTREGIIKTKEIEASNLEFHNEIMPKYNSTLHGFAQQHKTYGIACCLAKRWISSQLLCDYISEQCIELLMAYIYDSPAPYSRPGSSYVAFLRFLFLLSTYDWKNAPLIINLNDEIKSEDHAEIHSLFNSQRINLPSMFIATPFDKTRSIWTINGPTPQMLQRLMTISSASFKSLEAQMKNYRISDCKQIFRPPLDPYDVIIHLKLFQVPKHYLAVDVTADVKPPTCELYVQQENTKLPVVGYDPVQCYLKELRECYDKFALFFYDSFGGEYITVLWKPQAFKSQSFKVSQISYCKLSETSTDGSETIVPNVEAILEDFAIKGQGLVKNIEIRTEKWVID